MYDYVLQYGFDNESHKLIQEIKDYLKKSGIKDRERNWLPHITIDLYNCKNQKEFIDKLDLIIKNIKQFNIEFKNLNTFYNETLYIEPYNKDYLMKLKSLFDKELNDYMLEKRKLRTYMPHVTLCTCDEIDTSKTLALNKFVLFSARVKYIWVYSRDMTLIKEYKLEK